MKRIPIKPLYGDENCFHWQSDLTPERKKEIIAWIQSHSLNELSILHDLIVDVRDTERGRQAEEEAGADI